MTRTIELSAGTIDVDSYTLVPLDRPDALAGALCDFTRASLADAA